MKHALSLLLMVAAGSTCIDAHADPVAAIQNFCQAKSLIPFADSRETCIGIAKSNAKKFLTRLEGIQGQLADVHFVRSEISDLKSRLNVQLSFAQKFVPSFDLSHLLGTEEIQATLHRAYQHASQPGSRELPRLIQSAHDQLVVFEQKIR